MVWLHDLPTALGALLILAVVVGGSLGGLLLSRHWGRRRGLHALVDNGVIGWIFSAILGIYAIAIGLIAIASWGNAAQASGVVSREAAQIATLYRFLGSYPEPAREKFRAAIADYTRYVIEEAWPLQRQGKIPHAGTIKLDDYQREFFAFEPQTPGQTVLHESALEIFASLLELYDERIEAIGYAVPGTLWGVVLAGGFLSILASYVFNMESLAVHAVMTGLLAAMIGLLVFFIAITDLPFHGRNGIGPGDYELVLREQMELRGER